MFVIIFRGDSLSRSHLLTHWQKSEKTSWYSRNRPILCKQKLLAYEEIPTQFWTLPWTQKNSLFRAQKIKNTPKIKSESKIQILINSLFGLQKKTQNDPRTRPKTKVVIKGSSDLWLDPKKIFFENYYNSKNSPFGAVESQNNPIQKLNVKMEGRNHRK